MTEDQVRQDFDATKDDIISRLFDASKDEVSFEALVNAAWISWKAATELAEKRHDEDLKLILSDTLEIGARVDQLTKELDQNEDLVKSRHRCADLEYQISDLDKENENLKKQLASVPSAIAIETYAVEMRKNRELLNTYEKKFITQEQLIKNLEREQVVKDQMIQRSDNVINELTIQFNKLQEIAKWNKNYGRRPVKKGYLINIRIRHTKKIIESVHAGNCGWDLGLIEKDEDIIEWQLAEESK